MNDKAIMVALFECYGNCSVREKIFSKKVLDNPHWHESFKWMSGAVE